MFLKPTITQVGKNTTNGNNVKNENLSFLRNGSEEREKVKRVRTKKTDSI